ncbi:MAG: hypothetical protein KIH67_002955 [Candidatus Moranbacteria bacterium]|nr:hypothetical protein [Candidatus Moranbacteria bacterium]
MIGQGEIDKAIYYPMLASEELNGGVQSPEESRGAWTIYKTLSPEAKMFLMSDELPQALVEMKEKNQLSELEIEAVSVAIRLFKLGQIDEIDIPVLLKEILPNQEKTTNVFFYLKQYIFPLKVSPQKEEEEELVEDKSSLKQVSLRKLQVLQALSEYPNLGNQTITGARIRIKSQSEPVRGSLYNWIKYYRDELGIGQHSTVERGQFLFRSENSKNLPIEERERINLILKSIEENYALDIDTEKQVIVFPVMHVERQGVVPQKREEEIVDAKKVSENTPKNTPAPTAFFAPRTVPQKEEAKLVVEKPQENAFSSGKAAISNQWLPEKKTLPVSPDFTQEAEKLKREPKPDWIKGAFTKESIPDEVKPEPIKGAVSFSLNHVLPVEQETKKKEEGIQFTDSKDAKDVSLPKKRVEAPATQTQPRRNQFHIRPVSRGDF